MKIRAVLRTYAILLAGRFASKALVFLSAAIAARTLGPSQTGVFGTYLTGLAIAWIFMNTGMDAIAIKLIGRERGKALAVVRQLVRLRATIGLGLFALALAGAWITRSDPALVFPLGFAALAYSFRCDWTLLALGRDSGVSVAATLREIVYFTLVAWVVVLSPTVNTALWCYAVAEVMWSVATIVMLRSALRSDHPVTEALAGSLAADGWPIGVMALMVLLYNKADTPLLVWMRGPHEAGLYWAAYSVVFGVMGIAAELSRASFVHMARTPAQDEHGDAGQVMSLSILTSAVGLCMALAISGGAALIVRMAYGPDFEAGARALQILAWCVWANYSYSVLQQRAIINGLQTRLALIAGAAVVGNIALNLWLIPLRGMTGAALASVFAEVTILVGALWANWEHRGVRWVLGFQAASIFTVGGLTIALRPLSSSSPVLATSIVVAAYAVLTWRFAPLFVRRSERAVISGVPGSPGRLERPGTCRVGVFQRIVPHYRAGILDRLARCPGIELSVYATRFDRPLVHATSVIVKEYRLGRMRIHPGVLSRARLHHDVLLCEGGLSLLTSVLAVVGRRAARVPVVWWTSLWRRDGSIRVGKDARGMLTRSILSRCAAVVTYSQKAAKVAIESGVPAARVFTATNSLDTEMLLAAEKRWAERPAKLRSFVEQLGISDTRNVLFVGRLTRGKGLDTLLEAFADCVRSRRLTDVRLVLVGDGEERARLEGKIRALGLEAMVVMCGEITEPEAICPYFLSAEMVVLPGSGGLALNQALTHGVPVIVGGGDGTERDIVHEGVNGFFVRPNDRAALSDRILALLDVPAGRRREMAAAARSAVLGRADGAMMLQSLLSAIALARSESISGQSGA